MHQVDIIGAPVACKEGVKETWREVADWTAGKLKLYFNDRIQVRYFDLFDAQCPAIPAEGQLPVVLLDGVVINSGGKVSVPLIRKKIEELG